MTEKLRNALQLINMNTAYLDEIEVTMTKPAVAFVLRFDNSFMACVLIQSVILKLNYPEAKECQRRTMFLKFSALAALCRAAVYYFCNWLICTLITLISWCAHTHTNAAPVGPEACLDVTPCKNGCSLRFCPPSPCGPKWPTGRHHSSGLFSRVGFNGTFDFCQPKCYWWLRDLSLHCSGWEARTASRSWTSVKNKIHYEAILTGKQVHWSADPTSRSGVWNLWFSVTTQLTTLSNMHLWTAARSTLSTVSYCWSRAPELSFALEWVLFL